MVSESAEVSTEQLVFEQTVANALLAGDDPILETLRLQLANATVKERDLTGVGFFIHYLVPGHLTRIQPQALCISDIFLEVEQVPNGAMGMMVVHNGSLDYLEVCTYTDNFPHKPVLKSSYYFKRNRLRWRKGYGASQKRDLRVMWDIAKVRVPPNS